MSLISAGSISLDSTFEGLSHRMAGGQNLLKIFAPLHLMKTFRIRQLLTRSISLDTNYQNKNEFYKWMLHFINNREVNIVCINLML